MGTQAYGDAMFNKALQAQLNVDRFARFKTYQATKILKKLNVDDKDFTDKAQKVINTFNRFQVTEFNTITARCRSAKQWAGFEETRDLYPNIRWLPSRSAHPREEHTEYYYRVWPMNDPFWDTNQPGNEWNCKCDWEETDVQPTDNSAVTLAKPSTGLDVNPGKEGVIITDNHPYISFTSKAFQVEVSNMMRADLRDEAIKQLTGKKVMQVIDGSEVSIKITKSGLKHIAGDFDNNRDFKNALLPHIDQVLTKAKHVGTMANYNITNTMDKAFHYFAFNILGRQGFLHVAESISGELRLYAYRNTKK